MGGSGRTALSRRESLVIAASLSTVVLLGAFATGCGSPGVAEVERDLTILNRVSLEPLAPDGDLRYGPSFQGGSWAMPALRVRGVEPIGVLNGEIVDGAGKALGSVSGSPAHLIEEASGTLRADWLGIPIADIAAEPIGSKAPARLHIAFVDETGLRVESQLPVTLVSAESP